METNRGDVYTLGASQSRFEDHIRAWEADGATQRLWARDATLWSNCGEDEWLGWLDAVDTHRASLPAIDQLTQSVREDGLTDVLLLGMGGSSLCPEVVAESFGPQDGYPTLHVLDSTVPDQVRRFRANLDLSKTLISVASKSGSTVEPNVLLDYFSDELLKSSCEPRRHIVAVTDPGSSLEGRASDETFRAVLHGVPEIGGRFSALSNFGLLPAGLAGVDLNRYLDRASELVDGCKADSENPGVLLGAALGTARESGRDKVSLIVSPKLWDIGAWIEQLVAESTGKNGIGLCPVDQEPPRPVDAYADDRVFVYIRLDGGVDNDQDKLVAKLTSTGHPVVTLRMRDVYDLGAEFFRWEYATAVVGAIMKINPFDQPNVQESKDITSSLLAAYEQDGRLSEPESAGSIETLKVTSSVGGDTGEEALKALFSSIEPKDYFSISAYCDRTGDAHGTFQSVRGLVANATGCATTLGYGPRFLHSTGQLHKGGANSGVFLQITTAPDVDLSIPGKAATFGVLSRAQAMGDYQALVEKNRRVVRLDLSEGLAEGLSHLKSVVSSALS